MEIWHVYIRIDFYRICSSRDRYLCLIEVSNSYGEINLQFASLSPPPVARLRPWLLLLLLLPRLADWPFCGKITKTDHLQPPPSTVHCGLRPQHFWVYREPIRVRSPRCCCCWQYFWWVSRAGLVCSQNTWLECLNRRRTLIFLISRLCFCWKKGISNTITPTMMYRNKSCNLR